LDFGYYIQPAELEMAQIAANISSLFTSFTLLNV